MQTHFYLFQIEHKGRELNPQFWFWKPKLYRFNYLFFGLHCFVIKIIKNSKTKTYLIHQTKIKLKKINLASETN